MVCEGVDGDGDKVDVGDNDGDGGHLGCGVEGLRGRRLSGPRPGWATRSSTHHHHCHHWLTGSQPIRRKRLSV